MHRSVLYVALFYLALGVHPASAQVFNGQAVAVDGDTLAFGGTFVRLYGIDAPEDGQLCQRDGATWPCGDEAHGALADLVAGQNVVCDTVGADADGTALSRCAAGPVDLADALVTFGWAIALGDAETGYGPNAARARSLRMGIWAWDFVLPAQFRATDPAFLARMHQRELARRDQAARETAQTRRATADRVVYYRGCNEARAAGVTPLHYGQPGYRPELDGDQDGIACEDYPVRRW